MARKKKLSGDNLENYSDGRGKNESSLKALEKGRETHAENLKDKKSGSVRMSLNIGGYVDYLNTMSQYRGMTRNGYIRDLIESDRRLSEELYERISKDERYTQPIYRKKSDDGKEV